MIPRACGVSSERYTAFPATLFPPAGRKRSVAASMWCQEFRDARNICRRGTVETPDGGDRQAVARFRAMKENNHVVSNSAKRTGGGDGFPVSGAGGLRRQW